jgi:hypothetical protein
MSTDAAETTSTRYVACTEAPLTLSMPSAIDGVTTVTWSLSS